MNTLLLIFIFIVIAGFASIFYYLSQLRRDQNKPQDDQSIKIMMEWMRQLKDNTDQTRIEIQRSVDHTNKSINDRLDNAARVIGTVSKELGQMQQIGNQLSYVQEFLLSAKKRGNIGEQIMEEMIRQSLPPHMYEIQYRFKSGDIADSIVKINGRILAMDSKFSMENYRAYIKAETAELRDSARKMFVRDIKKRIDEIGKKYIQPAENTLDFALMYVPADGVFNEITDDIEIYEYARNKHVHLVSPSTFYYFLHVLLIGLQGARINEQAEQILKTIQGLRQDSEKFSEALGTLNRHVTNAKDTVDKVGTSFGKIHGKIEEIATLKIEKQDLKPEIEEQLKQPASFLE